MKIKISFTSHDPLCLPLLVLAHDNGKRLKKGGHACFTILFDFACDMDGVLTSPPDGLRHGFREGRNIDIMSTILFSIGLYNAVELVILIFLTFQRYTGLYFWSLLLSTVLGVIPHATGFILIFFNIVNSKWGGIMLYIIGWYFMVPGQSFILYSRLHLVLQNIKLLRAILWFISIASFVLIVPVTIFTFTTVYMDVGTVNLGFNVMERFQLTWFCVQECLLSSLYIREAVRLLHIDPPYHNNRRTQIKYELIAANAATIIMDIVLIVVEYLNWYIVQVTLKTAVYSVKLKLEFAVLGRLIQSVRCGPNTRASSSDDYFPDFVDPARVPNNLTHAAAAATGRPRRDMSESDPVLPTAPHYRSQRDWWPIT